MRTRKFRRAPIHAALIMSLSTSLLTPLHAQAAAGRRCAETLIKKEKLAPETPAPTESTETGGGWFKSFFSFGKAKSEPPKFKEVKYPKPQPPMEAKETPGERLERWRREQEKNYPSAGDLATRNSGQEGTVDRPGDPEIAARRAEAEAEREGFLKAQAEREQRWQEEQKQRREREEAARLERLAQIKRQADEVRLWAEQNLKNPLSDEARVFRDLVNTRVLDVDVGHDKVVVIAAGNTLSEMSEGQARSLEQVVRGLVNKGYRILYDADAKGADAIKTAAGDVALGISGNQAMASDRVVVVENPYMRMETLLRAREVIMTPDSILGVGLLFEGQGMSNVKFRVLDIDGKWTSGLGKWKKSTFDFELFARMGRVGHDDSGMAKDVLVHSGEAKLEVETNVVSASRTQDDAAVVKTSTPITAPKKKPSKGFFAALKDEAIGIVFGDPSSIAGKGADHPLNKPVEDALARPLAQDPLPPQSEVAAATEAEVKPEIPSRPRAENLGITYEISRDPRVFKDEQALVDSLSSGFLFARSDKPAQPIRMIDVIETVKALSDDFIVQTSEFAKGHAEALKAASVHPDTGAPIAGGMVVFGSGRGSYSMEKTVYGSVEAAAKLGVPIATGGAGGFMETANRAATVVGAFSTGIPIGGRNSLRSEKKAMSHLHDVTIMTSGYETRIPTLLHRREIVGVAPGGMGTMKEVAVTMVAQAASPTVGSNLVFIESGYYGGLVDWLKQSRLPEEYKARIGLVGDSAQMKELVELILKQEPDRKRNLIASRREPKKAAVKAPGPVGGGRDWFNRDGGDQGFGHGFGHGFGQ